MKRLLVLLAMALAVVAAGLAQDDEDQPTGPLRTLRYQPKSGMAWLLHTVTTSDQTITLRQTAKHKAKVEDERWERWDVLEVNDQGEFTIRATLSRFRQKIWDGEEMSEEVGTGLDGATTTSKDFAKAASGQTYTFRAQPTGEVISVDGLDKIVTDIKAKSADAFDRPMQKAFFDDRLRALYGKDNVLNTLSYRLKRYPKEQVQAEQRWTQKHKEDLRVGTMTTTERIRVAAKDAPDGSMRLLSEGWFNFVNSGREEVSVDLPFAKIEGEDILDPVTGFPKVRNTTYEVEVDVTIDRNGIKSHLLKLLLLDKEKMEFLTIK
ncbi:MAG: hypothetical protein HZB16_20045 [Armatimonadetes bacterium]|nr:hypothetical protein [Armatimonadota bacterium]